MSVRNKAKTIFISTLVTMSTSAGSKEVEWSRVIDAIGIHESRMLHSAIGDAGASRGAWQICRAAWDDVNKVRRAQKQNVYAWRIGAHNPVVARIYAREFLAMLTRNLALQLGRPPTVRELYAAYNIGFRGFKKRGFLIANCPMVTQEGAEAVENYCGK